MPTTANPPLRATSGSPWTARGFRLVHPDGTGPFCLIVCIRPDADVGFAVQAYVNWPGTTMTTPEATKGCLSLPGWDEPALTLLDIARHWGTHSFRRDKEEIPPALAAPLLRLCAGETSPEEFREEVEAAG